MKIRLLSMFENFWNILDENPSYRKPAVRYINYVYFSVYGFWRSKSIRKELKYFWFGYTVLSPLIILMSTSFCNNFKGKPALTFADYVSFTTPILGPSMTLFVHIPVRLYLERLLDLLKTVDEDFEPDFKELMMRKGVRIAKKSRLSAALHIYTLIHWISLIGGFFCTLPLIIFAKIPDDAIATFPLGCGDTTKGKAIVFVLQHLGISGTGICIFQILIFVDLLTTEIFDEFTELQDVLQVSGETLRARLGALHRRGGGPELSTITNRRLNDRLRRQTDEEKLKIVKNFQYDLILCIRSHQKLTKKVKTCQPILQYALSIIAIIMLLGAVSYGFFLILTTTRSSVISAIFEHGLVLYLLIYFHSIGSKYLKMNKIIANEVYALPWYELAPKYRKEICIFLALAQKDLQFYSVKIYPLSLDYMPKVANTIYSNEIYWNNENYGSGSTDSRTSSKQV